MTADIKCHALKHTRITLIPTKISPQKRRKGLPYLCDLGKPRPRASLGSVSFWVNGRSGPARGFRRLSPQHPGPVHPIMQTDTNWVD